jgi:enolase
MARIESISWRRILNSHVEFTAEFILKMADGTSGAGSSSMGETISIYEDRKITITPEAIVRSLVEGGCVGRELTQADFDSYLQEHVTQLGRNNAFSLSLAFFNATRVHCSAHELFGIPSEPLTPPRLSLNILNGGWHAYTNPVLSDFSEFMLLAKSDCLEEVIADHNAVQRVVREKQTQQNKKIIAGNPVNCFATADNREPIEFLLGVCEHLRIGNKYDLMIDASAGDLWTEERYRLAITTQRAYTREEFREYWLDILHQYPLRFLEDPFREADVESWHALTTSQHGCCIIGDNFYSSDPERIIKGAAGHCSHGVVLKPNQAGSVTAVRQAALAARNTGQIGIASHRSISTEETFVCLLACMEKLPYIKIGPLMTDYSSVMRLNDIIRCTETDPWQA